MLIMMPESVRHGNDAASHTISEEPRSSDIEYDAIVWRGTDALRGSVKSQNADSSIRPTFHGEFPNPSSNVE